MKVAFITYEYPPLGSGIASYAYNLAEELSGQGINIDVYIPSIIKKAKKGNCNIIKVPTVNLPLLRMFSFSLNIKKILKNRKYDVIHCNDVVGAFINSDFVTAYHSNLLQSNLYKSPLRRIDSRILSWYESRTFRNTRRVFAISEYSKKVYIREGIPENKIKVIYAGLDPGKFKKKSKKQARKLLKLPEGKLILCYVGRLVYHKNIQLILEILGKLNNPKILFLIIGKGEYYKGLIELVEFYNLKDKVKFLGYVSDEYLPLYYSASDIFINPSFLESFGLTVLEAAGCGCLVVVADSTAMREIVKDGKNGFLIDPNDEKSTLNKIKKIISLTDFQIRKISEKAIRTSKKFSWEDVAKKVLESYIEKTGKRE